MHWYYPDYDMRFPHGVVFSQLSQVNSFLKRAFKYGFCSRLYTIKVVADDADIDLFRKMTRAHHSFSITPCQIWCTQSQTRRAHI